MSEKHGDDTDDAKPPPAPLSSTETPPTVAVDVLGSQDDEEVAVGMGKSSAPTPVAGRKLPRS